MGVPSNANKISNFNEMKSIKSNTILVTYFSYSGNTKKIANQIHKLIGGDMFELKPIKNYPAKYNDVLTRAKQEIRSADKPELKEKLATIEQYDIIFIGYPNWWNTFPSPVLTFLTEYNFTGKTIVPFCTHGGGGIGNSIKDIAKQCPGAKIHSEFSINSYLVNDTNPELTEWLSSFKINV